MTADVMFRQFANVLGTLPRQVHSNTACNQHFLHAIDLASFTQSARSPADDRRRVTYKSWDAHKIADDT